MRVVAGINEKRQLDIFRVLSGILHMGNMLYQEGDNETCTVPVSTCKVSVSTGKVPAQYWHGFLYPCYSNVCLELSFARTYCTVIVACCIVSMRCCRTRTSTCR